MPIVFPTSLDTLTNPGGSDAMNGANLHSAQHANANDAIEALEAKVGIDNSGDANSLDYKARRAARLLLANTSIPAGNTVANTVSETFFGTTYTVGANTLSAGQVIASRWAGRFGTTVLAPTLRGRIYLGSVVLLDTGVLTLLANLTNNPWDADVTLTVNSIGAAGVVECSAKLLFSTTAVAALTVLVSGGAVTVDTTAASVFKASVQFGTADPANTITLRQMYTTVMGP